MLLLLLRRSCACIRFRRIWRARRC